jgi:phage tail-like protein
MPFGEFDTGVGHSFGLEIDGVNVGALSEISAMKAEQDVIELKENTSDGKYILKKLPGRPKGGEVTITRGLTTNKAFDDWVKESREGKMASARKGAAIIIYDYEGAAVKRYVLENAWAKTLELTTLKSGDTSVLQEKVTITFEGLTVQ